MEYKEFISFYTKDGQPTRAVMQALNVFWIKLKKVLSKQETKTAQWLTKKFLQVFLQKHQTFISYSIKKVQRGKR